MSNKLKLSVKTGLEFTVVLAPFQPHANLNFIDEAKLRSRKARLEVGEFIGGCCSTKVFAIVERGVVRKVEFSKCKESGRPPAFLKSVLSEALSKTGLGKAGSFAPMPLGNFLSHARRRFVDIDIGGGCITICIFDWCYFCCLLDGTPLCGPPIVVEG